MPKTLPPAGKTRCSWVCRSGAGAAEAHLPEQQRQLAELRQVLTEQAAAHSQLQAAHKLLQGEATAQRAAAANTEVCTIGILRVQGFSAGEVS